MQQRPPATFGYGKPISNLCKRISSCAIAYLFKMHLVLATEFIEKRRIEVDG